VKIRFGALVFAASFSVACGGVEGSEQTLDRSPGGAPIVGALAEQESAGSLKLRSGDLTGARSEYERSLGEEPDRFTALNDLAVSYALQGRFDAARQLLDDVVAHGDSLSQQTALLNLGELHAVEGYLSAARAYFESARSIDLTQPGPLYALALLSNVQGDGAVALELMQEAIELDTEGRHRAALVFVYPEERTHLEALLNEASGHKEMAAKHWVTLKESPFSALSGAALRRIGQ
jgi:tetratricopeptide (TPR) repeat protein